MKKHLGLVLGVWWLGLAAAGAHEPQAPEVDVVWGTVIPMRDGVSLNATLYRPRGQAKPAPALFTLTPYVGDTYHERGMYFARHGYPFAVVDCRGRGNSQGEFEPFSHDGRDGYDVVEWLAKQPWCNGKVGMWGGSYAGFDQWATLKEAPPHLATIVPAAAAYPGVDFPARNGIYTSYLLRWLTLTAGATSNQNLFADDAYWNSKFHKRYVEHVPFHKFDTFVGLPSPKFQKWLKHRSDAAHWESLVPSAKDYAGFDLPILSITGQYDTQQYGTLAYYGKHMEFGSDKGRLRHYLLLGPWDHAGTRTPRESFAGLQFGAASVLDLNQLHKEWYDWALKDGPRPTFLSKRVTYYVIGPNTWRHELNLDAVSPAPRRLYLTAPEGKANDVFHSGKLEATKPAADSPSSKYTYHPLDVRPGKQELNGGSSTLVDQHDAYSLHDARVIYHSEPFPTAVELAGKMKLVLWAKLDVPDTDFQVTVAEIRADGTSLTLAQDLLRARYREGFRRESLVKLHEPTKFEFASFGFLARRLEKGSRLRLLLGAPNSIYFEKNYNSGGAVEAETQADARTAHVTLLHSAEHASYLDLPLRAVAPE